MARIPTTLKPRSESFRWVPASSSGLTLPSLHRLTRRAPPLKYYGHRLYRRSLYIHIPDTQTDFVTGGFLSLYDHSTRNAGWYMPEVLPEPDHRARAVCTQAGGEVRTTPNLISNGLSLILHGRCAHAGLPYPLSTLICWQPSSLQ